MSLPLLPTTVIGSYSMPSWLERAKNDYLQRKISRHDIEDMHDATRKAAIKDQEVAGIDVVSDGELQRDNMIDYFAEKLAGVQIDGTKRSYYDFYDSVVRGKLGTAALGLADEVRFLRRFTTRTGKVSITGPHALVKRIRNEHYPSEETFALDLAPYAERVPLGAIAGETTYAAMVDVPVRVETDTAPLEVESPPGVGTTLVARFPV